jgi:hypothetical protein
MIGLVAGIAIGTDLGIPAMLSGEASLGLQGGCRGFAGVPGFASILPWLVVRFSPQRLTSSDGSPQSLQKPSALNKRLGRLWPTLRDRTPLRRSESVPLRLTGSVGVNVEQAA